MTINILSNKANVCLKTYGHQCINSSDCVNNLNCLYGTCGCDKVIKNLFLFLTTYNHCM